MRQNAGRENQVAAMKGRRLTGSGKVNDKQKAELGPREININQSEQKHKGQK